MGDEATLLQLATQLEAAQLWFDRLPAMAMAMAIVLAVTPAD